MNVISRSLVNILRKQVLNTRRNVSTDVILNAGAVTSKTSTTKGLKPFSEKENAEFVGYFPGVVDDLVSHEDYADIPDLRERFHRLLHYTVPTGNRLRGLTTTVTCKMLEKPDNCTPENIKLVNILGWCVELLVGSFVVADDMLDDSNTRRAAPCWYKLEDVGNTATMDVFILENSAHLLLRKHFCSHPFYLQMSELLTNVSWKVAIGQVMDSTKIKLEENTMERSLLITKYKTSYFAFWAPVTMGMYFSKAFDEKLHQQITPILLEMGTYFQIENDYKDSFVDVSVAGKEGTDIQKGRCTWMSARALQKVNSNQRKIMEEHFGKPDEESVRTVLALYRELHLPEEFFKYREKSFENMCAQIDLIKNVQLADLLQILVEKLCL